MGRGDQRMPWRRLCFARLCRMNVKFSDARSIRPWDFACSATFGAAPDSTGERKPHIQTLRKSPKFPGNRIRDRWPVLIGNASAQRRRVPRGHGRGVGIDHTAGGELPLESIGTDNRGDVEERRGISVSKADNIEEGLLLPGVR